MQIPASISSLYHDDAVLYADLQGLWLMVMFAPPDARRMLRAGPTLVEMAKRYPTGFCNVTWIHAAAGFSMDGDTRAAVTDVTTKHLSSIRAVCTVIEGEGFRVATVRAIVSGLQVLSRMSCPRQVFDQLDQAVRWSLEHSTPEVRRGFDRPAVERSLAELRAALPPVA